MANQGDFDAFVDTIIAEAGGEGRKGMIAVAHVINNRAVTRGQNIGAVVRSNSQFDGYSSPGEKARKAQKDPKVRSEAERVAREVLNGSIPDPTGGADHFYSGSKKPGWADRLTKTVDIGGHKFFRSAQAVAKPVVEAVARPIRNVADSVGSALRLASLPAQPSAPRGALAYELGAARRSQIPSSGIGTKVHDAATGVIPGASTHLYSGQEPRGIAAVGAKNRHPLGFAGDFYFTDPKGRMVTDPVALQDIAMSMAARHKANIGYSDVDYMGPGRVHIDTMPLDKFPGGAQWGKTAKTWADNLNFARQTGIGPTPYTNAPVPTARPAPSTPMAAPVGPVERAPLPTVAQRQAAPYQQYAASRLAAPTATPAMDAVLSTQPSPISQAKLMPASMVVPNFVPATPAPAPVQAPVQTPPVPVATPTVPRLKTPQTRIDEAFAQAAPPPTPRFTAMDVYQGRATQGMASDGSTVTADPYGRTTIENRFGARTTTRPSGMQAAPFGGGGIAGPMGGAPASPGSIFEARPDLRGRSTFGNTARMMGGGMAGSMVGGLGGPIGSLLGAMIGRELAKPGGGRIGDFVGGVRTIDTSRVGNPMGMTFGPNTQFARAVSGGPFPDRPKGQSGALGGKDSNRSERSMREISPAATRDIKSGKSGLY